MSIQSLASDLASRIPEMRHDNAINNANVIEGLIAKELIEHDAVLLLGQLEKQDALKIRLVALLGRIQGYGAVCDDRKIMDFETFQMLEANLAEVNKLATIALKELA